MSPMLRLTGCAPPVCCGMVMLRMVSRSELSPGSVVLPPGITLVGVGRLIFEWRRAPALRPGQRRRGQILGRQQMDLVARKSFGRLSRD
jgi:hypothetical protein